MTSRERVLAALEHRKPDRVPLNFFGTAETWRNVKRFLGLETDEEVRLFFGADMRYVEPRYAGPAVFSGFYGYASGGLDVWGVRWKAVENEFGTYNEVDLSPLAHARTMKELEEHPWPSLDWFDVSHLADEIRTLNRDEPRAIVLPTGNFFEIPWALRGFESFLADLLSWPEGAEFLLNKVSSFCRELTMRAVEAAEGQIDIVWSAGDMGMQTNLLIPPTVWRDHVKPYHEPLIRPFKEMGLKTRYHSDGAIVPIVEDLIEMGLDLLDPIQPKAAGMDAENLNRLFGGRLSFYGGVDTQELLPQGTPEEVEHEVLRLIEVLGADGGYIAAASNSIQPDVPVKNIIALFRTAREYRYS